MTKKKYNHAYSVSFTFDSDVEDGEEAIRLDYNNLIHALIKRAKDMEFGELEAFEHWDTYEH